MEDLASMSENLEGRVVVAEVGFVLVVVVVGLVLAKPATCEVVRIGRHRNAGVFDRGKL